MSEEVVMSQNPVPEKTTSSREWVAIRGECLSGGAMDDRCNLVATSQGTSKLQIVQQILSCGCILVPEDGEDDVIL